VRGDRIDNFWAPVPGDRGAHGRFDACAEPHSIELWLTLHRWWLGAALLGIGALAIRKLSRPHPWLD
jgi:hypothetical protein